ncbi:mCG147169 [Mus musculus]|nr:mCG147169 [Mus musculus]
MPGRSMTRAAKGTRCVWTCLGVCLPAVKISASFPAAEKSLGKAREPSADPQRPSHHTPTGHPPSLAWIIPPVVASD